MCQKVLFDIYSEGTDLRAAFRSKAIIRSTLSKVLLSKQHQEPIKNAFVNKQHNAKVYLSFLTHNPTSAVTVVTTCGQSMVLLSILLEKYEVASLVARTYVARNFLKYQSKRDRKSPLIAACSVASQR